MQLENLLKVPSPLDSRDRRQLRWDEEWVGGEEVGSITADDAG